MFYQCDYSETVITMTRDYHVRTADHKLPGTIAPVSERTRSEQRNISQQTQILV
jgi:hypothetical protein